MKKFNHAFPVFAVFFLITLILPISVLCFQDQDEDLFIKFLRISPVCTVDLLRKKAPFVTSKVPEGYRESVITPGANQEQLLRLAFSAVPEFVCKSVNKVVFVSKRNGDAAAFVRSKYPDLVIVVAPEDTTRSDNFPTEDRLAFSGEDEEITRIYRQNSDPVARKSVVKELVENRLEMVWSRAIKTIIHEATHSATNLLEKSKTEDPNEYYCSSYESNPFSRGFKVRDADYYPDFWDAGARSEAGRIVEQTGLQEGLYNEWCRMQKKFVEMKLSLDYDSDTKSDETALPMKGFFSKYGQRNPAEDIAEIASLIQFNHYRAQGALTVGDLPHLDSSVFSKLEEENAAWIVNWSDFANIELSHDYFNVCKEDMQTTTKIGISPDFVAIYTKMNFLRDLGFITEEAYKTCIGDGKIGLQNGGKETNGFHRLNYETGEWKYRHNIDKIGYTIVNPDNGDSDPGLFIIIGSGILNAENGKKYNMSMWLRFNKTNGKNLPRGIYKLDWDWESLLSGVTRRPCPPLFSSTDSPWTFYANVEKAPSRSFCAVNGQILVTRSSKDLIEATMIVNKVLKRVGGPPVQLPSLRVRGGIAGLAAGTVIPEVPNFRVYIRWKRQ
ncbi:MAG: hypothetical protein HKN25_06055 [Pyrinomonadaceae bacterium]|nr:hypothetical protein [Pyrinomonadaceae bacterium]